jgi:hypothetical protein
MKTAALLLMISLFGNTAHADKRMCVDTIHGKLCGNVVYFQDSSMKHFAYGVQKFTLDETKIVLSKDFSAKFLCHAFAPNSINPRPQLPLGMSKTTKKEVIRWTTYSNGDCRPTYGNALVQVDCYSDQ